MLLFGASGHCKVVIDCLESQECEIVGIFDDDLSKKDLLGYKVFGKYNADKFPNEKIILSVGDNKIRKNVSKIISHKFGNTIHKSVIIANNVTYHEGTVIFHNSNLQSSVKIGKHVIINTASLIDHDCEIGDFVHISPNATICGNVNIGEGTHIGAGAVIIPNIKIGKWATIGAGSVIIKDVPDYSVVVGNPGRRINTN